MYDWRVGFVLQDQLCRLLIHMNRLELISYIQLIVSQIFRNMGGIFVTPGSGVYK
jgi:hypothetical protein